MQGQDCKRIIKIASARLKPRTPGCMIIATKIIVIKEKRNHPSMLSKPYKIKIIKPKYLKTTANKYNLLGFC